MKMNTFLKFSVVLVLAGLFNNSFLFYLAFLAKSRISLLFLISLFRFGMFDLLSWQIGLGPSAWHFVAQVIFTLGLAIYWSGIRSFNRYYLYGFMWFTLVLSVRVHGVLALPSEYITPLNLSFSLIFFPLMTTGVPGFFLGFISFIGVTAAPVIYGLNVWDPFVINNGQEVAFTTQLALLLVEGFTLRFIYSFVSRGIRRLAALTTSNQVRFALRWFLDLLGLGYYALVIFIAFLLNSSYVFILVRGGGFFFMFFLILYTPLLLMYNLGFVINFFGILVSVFLGIPPHRFNFGLVNNAAHFFHFINGLANGVPLLFGLFVESVVGLFVLVRLSVTLPIEIIDIILNERAVNPISGRGANTYFWARFLMSFSIFVFVLIPFKLLLFIDLTFFFGVLIFAGVWVSFSEGIPVLTLTFFSIMQSLTWVLGLPVDRYSFQFTNDFKVSLIAIVLRARAFVIGGRYVLRVNQGGVNQQIRLGLTTDLNSFTPDVINQIFTEIFNVSAVWAFPSLIILIILYSLHLFFYRTRKIFFFFAGFPGLLLKALMYSLIPWFLPDFYIDLVIKASNTFILFLWRSWPSINRFLRALHLSYVYGVAYLEHGDLVVEAPVRGGGKRDLRRDLPRINSALVRVWISLTRRAVLKFVERLDDVRLPEMIQAAYRPPSLDSLRSTYVTLQGMGFPVDQGFIDSLDRPEASSYLVEWGSWKNWMLGTSNNTLGFYNVPLSLRSWLPTDFFPEILGFQHTTRIANVANEIRSTARYWTGKHKLDLNDDDFDALVEDVWEGVKFQYADSKLATFDYIYKNWVKRFNMGPGFFKRNVRTGRLKQLTRQAVIDTMGGKKGFMRAWEKVFKHAQIITMPSPVFTKWETLKVQKIIDNKVRTVVGSAFSEYVRSTPWNILPNHNYQPWITPSKVGMPLNGQNFNQLWLSLASHTLVWAGDMTAFDSSQIPGMTKVVAEIRKKGFEHHKDYHKLCQLIDVHYELLLTQPMLFKNFGDIATKGQGFTTGHASTTADNTIALLANYLFAWRRVTGLRAREFFNFNTLANFGDDHVLGYDPVFGWSPEAAIVAMRELGTEMRDEAPGQNQLPLPGVRLPDGVDDWRDAKFSFLAKKPLPLTPDVRAELVAAGIEAQLTFATCHDRARLLGKIKGEVTASKAKNTKSAYESLLGYMDLCAHHHDFYSSLARMSMGLYNKYAMEVKKAGGKVSSIRRPPSYNEVLRQWYKGAVYDPDHPVILDDNDELAGNIILINTPDYFGIFLRWLSDFPTLLSPRYRNTRWADWIQGKLAGRLSWPVTMVAMANGVLPDPGTARSLMARTPYSFLRHELIVPRVEDSHFGELLFRHWCFSLITRFISYRKVFTPFDLLRLADSVSANAFWILTGRVQQAVTELDLHVMETLIIFILSHVHVQLPILPLKYYVPAPSDLVAQAVTRAWGLFAPGGSIDFQPLLALVDRIVADPDQSSVVSAGTGTGKSTRMVRMIQLRSRRRVVVVVPRASVATGLQQYMSSLYPNSGIEGAAEGFPPLNKNFTICYTTAQSFFINPELRDPNNFFILDEAHIDEPHYRIVRNWFATSVSPRIWMTATPTDDLKRYPRLDVPAVNTFNVSRGEVTVKHFNDYVSNCAAFANERSSLEKILIFVTTISMMDSLAGLCRHKVCRLSSSHKVVDPEASVYIATSVADAGITIPDVSFVLSADVGLTVLHTESGSLPVHFRLSPQTIKQRAGRTGRTSNGAFLLFKLSAVDTVKLAYGIGDFLTAMAPAVEVSLPWFPKELVAKLPDHQQALVYLWDMPKSFMNFKDLAALARPDQRLYDAAAAMGLSLSELLKKAGVAPERGFERWQPDADPEVDPVSSFFARTVEPLLGFKTPSNPSLEEAAMLGDYTGVLDSSGLAPFSFPVPVVSQSAPIAPPVHRRVDVDGASLLCGARVLIGLYYTYHGVRLSEDLVRSWIEDDLEDLLLDADTMRDLRSFFEFGQLQRIANTRFGLRLQLFIGGVPQPITLVQPMYNHLPIAYVYLDHAHYNYHGIPYDSAPVNDSAYVRPS